MDPNAALEELREKLADPNENDLEEISILFEGLDSWLCRGGFLPIPWQRAAEETRVGRKRHH
jgi:hypothetical protein